MASDQERIAILFIHGILGTTSYIRRRLGRRGDKALVSFFFIRRIDIVVLLITLIYNIVKGKELSL